MIEVGRLCIKTAGRDAGLKCVIADILDKKYVLVDGQTRRRKCNILHLEPLKEVIKIPKNASHEAVVNALDEMEIKVTQTKPKQKTERSKKKRKTSEQLMAQKEEKRKLMGVFKVKAKKEEKAKAGLEEKAGLAKEKKE